MNLTNREAIELLVGLGYTESTFDEFDKDVNNFGWVLVKQTSCNEHNIKHFLHAYLKGKANKKFYIVRFDGKLSDVRAWGWNEGDMI